LFEVKAQSVCPDAIKKIPPPKSAQSINAPLHSKQRTSRLLQIKKRTASFHVLLEAFQSVPEKTISVRVSQQFYDEVQDPDQCHQEFDQDGE
jgi:hypothetical protein